jgi:hypothetical protein
MLPDIMLLLLQTMVIHHLKRHEKRLANGNYGSKWAVSERKLANSSCSQLWQAIQPSQ